MITFEIVKGKLYGMLRVFPSKEHLEKCKFPSTPTFEAKDTFFDCYRESSGGTVLGEQNKYLRRRVLADDTSSVVLQEPCLEIHPCIHLFVYVEKEVDTTDLKSYPDEIVSYTFKRFTSTEFSSRGVEVYYDIVESPFSLHVLSVRKCLGEVTQALITMNSFSLWNISGIFLDQIPLQDVEKEICDRPEILPARTKFMSMLQLNSQHGNLYYTTYMQFDAAAVSSRNQYKQLHERDKDLLTKYKFERDLLPHLFYLHVLCDYGNPNMKTSEVQSVFDQAYKSEQASDQLPWLEIDVDEYM